MRVCIGRLIGQLAGLVISAGFGDLCDDGSRRRIGS